MHFGIVTLNGSLIVRQITPVSGTPSLTGDFAFAVLEEDSYVISTSDFKVTDSNTTNSALTLTFSDPTNGVIKVNNVVSSTATYADLVAGLVSYTHNGSETSSDSFTITVSDGTTTLAPRTILVSVSATDDAPVLSGTYAGTVLEGGELAITTTVLDATDSDTADSSLVFTVTSPTNGVIEVDGVEGTSFTVADIEADDVKFVPSGDADGSFTVALSDGTTTLATQVISVTVNPLPTLSGNNLWDRVLINGDGTGTIGTANAFSGDNLTFTATYEAGALPTGWSINSSTGVISYSDDVLALGAVEVTATNGDGGSVSRDFTVEVLSSVGAETVTGDQAWAQYVSNADDYPVIDLTGATWNSDNDSTPSELEYPVRIRNYTASVVVRGGHVAGSFHAGMEWGDVYAQGNSVAIFPQDMSGARVVVYGFSAHDIFDGGRLTNSDGTTINNMWIRGARDDAIELEKAGDDVLVKDSLFEYCFSGLSISEDQTAVAGHTFTFENVLVHMSRYLYGTDVTHGNPIKGGDPDPVEVNPDLVMNNCVLAITDVNHLNTRFEHAMGAITSGSNNLLLNLTDDALPGGYPTLHASFTILNGSAARAEWLARRAAFFSGNPVHTDVEDDRISFIVGVPSGGSVYHGFSDGTSSGNGAGYTFGTPMDMAIDGTTVSYLTVTTGGLLRIGFAGQVQLSGVTDVEVTLPGLEEGPITCTWNGTWYEAAGAVAARNTYMEGEDGNYLTVRVVRIFGENAFFMDDKAVEIDGEQVEID